ncbi:MAG: hypothetical protein WHS44_13015 [Fimbriimonadales bacterium]|nr:MAG: hypothetical protein KatS3mg018_0027 [Fimbriimonadales bacterium]
MRRIAVVLGALYVALGWCADDPLAQRVSYDQPAHTLETLLRDLSKQTNLKLYPAPELKQEIVLVAVQEMPLQELMRHLAFVADAEWIAESARQYRLARTPAVAARRRQEDREQTRAALREMLADQNFRRFLEPLTREEVVERVERIRKQLREVAAEQRDWDSLWEFHHNLRAREWEPLDPQRRLLCRIVQQLDIDALAEIPPDERRVFSNASGRYLLPLRMNLTPLLQQWRAERETFEGVLTSVSHQFTEVDKQAMGYFWWQVRLPEAQTPTALDAPLRVYMEVHRGVLEKSFRFILHLVDENNRLVASAEYPPDGEAQGWEQRRQELFQKDSALAKPVEWREATQRWLEAQRMAQSSREVQPFPDLLDPARHEPLAFVATDVLRSYARHRQLPLVALMDDGMLLLNARVSGEQQLLADFLHGDWWEMDRAEGALRVKPRLSSLNWRARESRAAVSRWIRQIVARGYFTLDDWLNAAEHPVLADMYLAFLSPGTIWGHLTSFSQRSQPIVPLIKHLAKETAARPDGSLEQLLHRLAARELQSLERVVYHNPQVKVSSARMEFAPLSARVGAPAPLPHVHFPNGLPRDATLRCRMEATEGVLRGRSGVGVWGDFSPVRWLQRVVQSADTDDQFLLEERDALQNSLLLPALRQELYLSLPLKPDAEVLIVSRFGARGYRLTRGDKPLRWDELPPEFLKPPEEKAGTP